MELHHLHARAILRAHDRVREAPGCVRLSHAGRARQDYVLLAQQKCAHPVVRGPIEVDLVKECGAVVWRGRGDELLGDSDIHIVLGEQRFELAHIIAVGRYVSECLQHRIAWMFPLTDVRPFHRAHVSPRITVRLESRLRDDFAATDDLLASALGVDDIADGDLVLELPETQHIVLHRRRGARCLGQIGPDRFPIGVLREVADFGPPDRHDALALELIPS